MDLADWTAASTDASVDGVFFQHAAAGDVEPTLGLLADFPVAEFDTFFADPPELFDDSPPGFAEGPYWTANTVQATWFDIDDSDPGTYTVARFTFRSDLWIEGNMTFGSDNLWPYEFTTVPAPATGLLLALPPLARRRSGGR
jgi:hypothetical protein